MALGTKKIQEIERTIYRLSAEASERVSEREKLKRYKIGFIGQGWVGKNYADHFEDRGFTIIRYALEEPYRMNRDAIAECDVVFIAVPTPSTPQGFDDRHVRNAVSLVGEGKVAVIKSTIPPGTTMMLARSYPDRYVLHAPEFLRESFARMDVDNPARVFVGVPNENNDEYLMWARTVLLLHPNAPHARIIHSNEAEFIKYVHNTMGYTLIVFMNILYDLARKHCVDWKRVRSAIESNPWYPEKYLDPVHKSGRGAGGHCFIKDFASLRETYEKNCPKDKEGIALLRAFEEKNNRLLCDSGKDIDLLRGVYGNVS